MTASLTPLQSVLVERLQRGFPLVPAPFAAVADGIGASEAAVIEAVRDLIGRRIATRLGAVVRPNTAGASTLAALACAPDEVDRLGTLLCAEPGVTHNYAREHPVLPLWFVVTGASPGAVAATLARIRSRTHRQVIAFPLEKEYRIDLAFGADPRARDLRPDRAAPAVPVLPIDRRILAAIENGLPLVSTPYAEVGAGLGWSEAAVRRRLACLLLGGVVKRMGLVVRHRSLGFDANAMVVFALDPAETDAVAARFLTEPAVTLLYARRPDGRWPYRLYCMIHGRSRGEVVAEVERLVARVGRPVRHEVLFSTRCFKQTGARLSA
jgi:DNA-binding Lrp family transcriptional regulator